MDFAHHGHSVLPALLEKKIWPSSSQAIFTVFTFFLCLFDCLFD